MGPCAAALDPYRCSSMSKYAVFDQQGMASYWMNRPPLSGFEAGFTEQSDLLQLRLDGGMPC